MNDVLPAASDAAEFPKKGRGLLFLPREARRKNKTLTVVVDADVIVAQANPEDSNHSQAVKIAKNLISCRASVIYPVTAVVEAVTHIQRALSSGATAYGTAQLMTDPQTSVVEVDKQTMSNALKYFSPVTSKKNTLFDCIVAAVAEEYKADAIFSFDKFYKNQGFKLARELNFSTPAGE